MSGRKQGRSVRLPRLAPNCVSQEAPIGFGSLFGGTVILDEVPDGYRAMDDLEALKVLVRP